MSRIEIIGLFLTGFRKRRLSLSCVLMQVSREYFVCFKKTAQRYAESDINRRRMSVCLSERRLSIRLVHVVYCVKTAKDIVKLLSRPDKKVCRCVSFNSVHQVKQ